MLTKKNFFAIVAENETRGIMKQVYPIIEEETYEEQSAARRYNPAQVAIYKGVRFSLSCGTSDDIYFYATSDRFYCVSINKRHDYTGLQEFFISGEYAGQEAGEMFLQSEDEIESVLGKKGLDYSPRTIAKKLSVYID